MYKYQNKLGIHYHLGLNSYLCFRPQAANVFAQLTLKQNHFSLTTSSTRAYDLPFDSLLFNENEKRMQYCVYYINKFTLINIYLDFAGMPCFSEVLAQFDIH